MPREKRIFVAHSSQDAEIARQIASALRAEHHHVFLASDDLSAGEAYNRRIREEIETADIFVFLVSPASIAAGCYTLLELELAQRRWPSGDRVLPVMVSPTPTRDLPAYLKPHNVLQTALDLPATVALHVDRMGRPSDRRSRHPGDRREFLLQQIEKKRAFILGAFVVAALTVVMSVFFVLRYAALEESRPLVVSFSMAFFACLALAWCWSCDNGCSGAMIALATQRWEDAIGAVKNTFCLKGFSPACVRGNGGGDAAD